MSKETKKFDYETLQKIKNEIVRYFNLNKHVEVNEF